MAYKLSTPLKNARLAQIQSVVGASPLLRLYAGTPPATCGDAAGGTLLAELTLPPVFLSTPSGGQATQSGTWTTPAALASGTPTYFRIYDAAGTTCHLQGLLPGELPAAGEPVEAITAGSEVSIVGYVFNEVG